MSARTCALALAALVLLDISNLASAQLSTSISDDRNPSGKPLQHGTAGDVGIADNTTSLNQQLYDV